MTQTKTAPRAGDQARPVEARRERHENEPVPTWRNTRPRGNPETDRYDLERARERLEALLGR